MPMSPYIRQLRGAVGEEVGVVAGGTSIELAPTPVLAQREGIDVAVRLGVAQLLVAGPLALATAHQAITASVNGVRHFEVIDAECVGCNLCFSVCPVEGCITMRPMTSGVDPRTGLPIASEKADWTTHPNNPGRRPA